MAKITASEVENLRGYSDLRRLLRSRWGIGALVFLGAGAVLLILDQRAHVAGNNHVLGGLLLACIVMYWRLALIEECNTEATPEGSG